MTDSNPELRRLIREALGRQMKVHNVYAGGAYSGGAYSGGRKRKGGAYSGGAKMTRKEKGPTKATLIREIKSYKKKECPAITNKTKKQLMAILNKLRQKQNPFADLQSSNKPSEGMIDLLTGNGILVGGRKRRYGGAKRAANQNPWIKHVKAFAKAHRMKYSDALKHPDIRKGY